MIPLCINSNGQCDRCGMQDPIPRGYGFGKVDYNLCRFCAEKWEKVIRNEHNSKRWHEKKVKWENYANKILTNFVLRVDEPEKVEFT